MLRPRPVFRPHFEGLGLVLGSSAFGLGLGLVLDWSDLGFSVKTRVEVETNTLRQFFTFITVIIEIEFSV